ncbi:MAG: hypothetical protein LLG04_10640 [Parachlamydia sp.]|nr:hypothetical protein [Parachlamydia sp.]
MTAILSSGESNGTQQLYRLKIPSRMHSAQSATKDPEDWRHFPLQQSLIEAKNFITYGDEIGVHLWKQLTEFNVLDWDGNETYLATLKPLSSEQSLSPTDRQKKISQFHAKLLPYIQKLIDGKGKINPSDQPQKPFMFPLLKA